MVVPQPHIPITDGPHLRQVWPALLSPQNPAPRMILNWTISGLSPPWQRSPFQVEIGPWDSQSLEQGLRPRTQGAFSDQDLRLIEALGCLQAHKVVSDGAGARKPGLGSCSSLCQECHHPIGPHLLLILPGPAQVLPPPRSPTLHPPPHSGRESSRL